MADQNESSERVCRACNRILDEKQKGPCPHCGSSDTLIRVTISDTLNIKESGHSIASHWVKKRYIQAIVWILMLISLVLGLLFSQIVAMLIGLILGVFGIIIGRYGEYLEKTIEKF